MTFEQFDKFQSELLAEVVKMKDTKGKEYACGGDRFANFNQDAQDLELDRLKCTWVFTNKHIRAIKSFIRNRQTFSTESIRGRIVDAITYLTLIAGMIEEDQKNAVKSEMIVASNLDQQRCGTCNEPFKAGELTGISSTRGKVHLACPVKVCNACRKQIKPGEDFTAMGTNVNPGATYLHTGPCPTT